VKNQEIQKAYNLIESCLEYDKDMSESPDRYEKALQIAKEIFDKQVSRKPNNIDGEYTCIKCDITIAMDDEYCWFCGQKLDWEAVE